MAWFGSVRSFHSSALNSFARTLAKLQDVPADKVGQLTQMDNFLLHDLILSTKRLSFSLELYQVEKLFDYCPPVSESGEQCILHDRGLSAVVALGLFAVHSKLKVLCYNQC